MMKIYLFSGMGADTRLFNNLGPIEGYEIIPLSYINPGESKSLGDYAALLSNRYTFEEPFLLGGVSMGGMIAQELATLINPVGLILISTATSRKNMPVLLRGARRLVLGSLMKKPVLEVVAKFADRFTKKSPEGRKLFLDMLHDSEPDFMRFAANAILAWEPPKTKFTTLRIHGTKDRVFPAKKIGNSILVEGGSHFMIIEKGEEITKIIADEIDAIFAQGKADGQIEGSSKGSAT